MFNLLLLWNKILVLQDEQKENASFFISFFFFFLKFIFFCLMDRSKVSVYRIAGLPILEQIDIKSGHNM